MGYNEFLCSLGISRSTVYESTYIFVTFVEILYVQFEHKEVTR